MKLYIGGSCLFLFLIFFSAIGVAEDQTVTDASVAEVITWQKSADSDLIEIAKKLVSEKLSHTAVTELYYHQDIEIGKKWVKRRIKHILFLPDAQAVNDYGTEILYFNNNNESVKLHTIASMSASGVVQKMAEDSVKVLDSDSYNSFTDSKKIVLPLPGVAPLSLMLIDYEVTQQRSLIEMGYADFIGIKHIYNREKFKISARWDEPNSIVWKMPSDEVSCSQMGDNQLECRAKEIPALIDDVSVYWRDVLDQFVIAEKTTWQDAVDYSLVEFSKASEGVEEVTKLIQRLTKDEDTTEQKIEKLYHFVARSIRYTSFSEYGHTITPHTFGDVIKNKYGDCKDKSALLVEMLRQLGIDAYPVLVATKRKRTSQLHAPALSYFNHMIACFHLKGTKYCLDPTDFYTDWKTTSDWIQGKVALELIKGTGRLSNIESSRYRWRLKALTTLTFDDKGDQKETTTKKYSGEYASSMRNFLLNKSEQERNTWLVDDYQRKVSNKVTPEFEVLKLNAMDHNFVTKLSADHKALVDLTEDLSYSEYDSWIRDELTQSNIDNKHYGYWFNGLLIDSTFRVNIGDNWRLLTTGAELDLEHRFGDMYRYITKLDEHSVEYITSLEIPEQYVKVEDIPAFNKYIKLLKAQAVLKLSGKRQQ